MSGLGIMVTVDESRREKSDPASGIHGPRWGPGTQRRDLLMSGRRMDRNRGGCRETSGCFCHRAVSVLNGGTPELMRRCVSRSVDWQFTSGAEVGNAAVRAKKSGLHHWRCSPVLAGQARGPKRAVFTRGSRAAAWQSWRHPCGQTPAASTIPFRLRLVSPSADWRRHKGWMGSVVVPLTT